MVTSNYEVPSQRISKNKDAKTNRTYKVEMKHYEMEKGLAEVEPEKFRGGIIGSLVSSRAYVYQGTLIKELVDALNKKSEISAVGVVDENNIPKGIIVRKDLFNMLGKPFGKEVLENKYIEELMESSHINDVIIDVPIFKNHKNIFSLLGDLGEELQTEKIRRYILVNQESKFAGIVTNINILLYLSSITQKDIKTAQNLQASIVKNELEMKTSQISIAAVSKMAKGVGGDFYDVTELKEKQWLLSLCDVSGKGVSAALVTGILGGVKSMYDFKVSVSNFIKKLNRYIFDSFQTEKYLTGLFIKFDEETGYAKIYDMGHSLIYIFRNGELFKLKTPDHNFPIGIQENLEVKSTGVKLRRGDLLLSFTDGVIEQANEAKEEFGVGRLIKILKISAEISPLEIGRKILEKIKDFRGKEPQHDDITAVFLKYG